MLFEFRAFFNRLFYVIYHTQRIMFIRNLKRTGRKRIPDLKQL